MTQCIKVFGNRKISIGRELTKKYEEIILSDLVEIKKILNSREEKNIPLKGEIVLVIDGFKNSRNLDINEIRKKISKKLKTMSLKDTVEDIYSKRRFYQKKSFIQKLLKLKTNLQFKD